MNDTPLNALTLVRQALSRYTDTPLDAMQLDTKLADIQIDSLTLAELLFELEDQLHVSMSEPANMPQSVGDLVALVQPYMASADAAKLRSAA